MQILTLKVMWRMLSSSSDLTPWAPFQLSGFDLWEFDLLKLKFMLKLDLIKLKLCQLLPRRTCSV